MESLKKLLEFGRQHYEKIALSLVFLGLGGAVYYLYLASQEEKDKIDEYFRTQVQGRKVKGVEVVELTSFEKVKQAVDNRTLLNLSAPHNLFNPVKWQKRPDGSLFKIQSGKEIGPYALSIIAIRPLHMVIAVDRPAGSGYWMVLTNEMFRPRYPGYRTPQFITLGATNNTRTFALREVRPQDNPTEWIIELLDSGEKVSITKERPYRQVVAYEADLQYDVESRTINQARVDQRLRLSGEEYNIVAINSKEVLLSAVSNDRRFAIQIKGAP